MTPWPRIVEITALITLVLLTAACRGGGDDGESAAPQPLDPGAGSGGGPAPTYSVGGTVTGLTGSGLVISNNATDQLTIAADGSFAFLTRLADAGMYSVAIDSQPTNPDDVCTVEDGTGTVNGADVTDVQVTCTGPFALLDSAPVDDDQNVSRRILPRLVFSADVDAATALPGSFVLRSAAGPIEVTASVSGRAVTLTPSAMLLPLTDYTLTVEQDLQGAGGERLRDAVTIGFRTRDGEWQPVVGISDNASDPIMSRVAFDASGQATAVWSELAPGGYHLFSNDYDPVDGQWRSSVLVHEPGTEIVVGDPRIAFDSSGHGIAAWARSNVTSGVPTATTVWANRYVPGTGWDPAAAVRIDVEPSAGDSFLDLAVHPNGEAIAIWDQRGPADVNVWASRYTPQDGWETAERIASGFADSARVAFDADGNAHAVWEQRDGTIGKNIWGNRYVAGTGWATPVLISTTGPGIGSDPQLVVDADGNAIAVWRWNPGFGGDIHASRYTPASGWSAPVAIESQSENTEYPQLAVDREGHALAVWEQVETIGGMVRINVYANRYTRDVGWGTEERISDGDVFYPKIIIDPSGHALAVWQQLDVALLADGYSVWANRYVNGSGWSASEQIGGNGARIVTFTPNLAVDSSGNAFAIWSRAAASGLPGQVQVSRFE